MEITENKLLKCAEMLGFGQLYKEARRPEYNSKFKKHVQELAVTCVYDYGTVYRVCSIFGVKKAGEIINSSYEVHIKYLVNQFWYFPDPMDAAEEEAAGLKLRYIDPCLPELFESLLESSGYNSETLYWVFMSHGSGAKEIIEYAIGNELMPFQLLQYSDAKLDERAKETRDKFRECVGSMNKEDKLPKKLRNGWK